MNNGNHKIILLHYLDIFNKPFDVTISTMTITCKINKEFYLDHIIKYINDPDIKIKIKTKTKKQKLLLDNIKKKKKEFLNQLTLEVTVNNEKIINIKLFTNGSIQLTGCNTIENTIMAIEKTFNALKNINVYDSITNNYIKATSDPDFLDIKYITDFKIAMINSNFNIDFNIDRMKLYNIMKTDNLNCSFDPNLHAAVIFKHKLNNDKEISIFIFEKGSIVITGANNCLHIKNAYDFINRYLLSHYKTIVKKNDIINKIIQETLNITL